MTPIENQIEILGTLYSTYRDEEEMADFFEYNDLGLPLAYLITEELAAIQDKGRLYIEETWKLFLQSLGIEDMGFDSLDQTLKYAEDNGK